MGMDYYLYTDKETDCTDDFPEGLSNFFEQVGGLGDTAEAGQVSRILGIDLSVFQDVDDADGDITKSKKHWQDLEKLILVVNDFIDKINQQPDFYNKIQYNPDKQNHGDILSEMLMKNDTEQMLQWLQKMQGQPLHNYPTDRGYISSGALLTDLQALQATLSCYKENGVKRVKLVYM